MADKQGGEVTKADSESALLREEIVSLISSRLESIGINPTKQEISKVLNRRKKKWRKRHKSEPQRPEYQPLDPSLRGEKESISFTLNKLTEKLVQRRREGFSLARQQQREKGEYSTDAFSHWLRNTKDFVQSHQTETSISQPGEATTQHNLEHERLLKDLNSAISQATSLSEIHTMKHDMTPRLPPIQDRTLSGNILDASLGVFRLPEQPVIVDSISQEVVEMNGITNGDEDVVTEYMDAQLTIGKVVNVEQDSCYRSDIEEELHNDRSVCAESDVKNETVVLRVDNESSDDTPGVGMEIVCGAASDLEAGPFVVSQSHGLNSTNRVCGTSSSPLRGSEERDTDQVLHDLDSTFCVKNHSSIQQQQQQTPVKANKLTRKRKSAGKGIEIVENSTDTDSDSHFGKILEIIERAPYELRIPPKSKNYSTGIRRRRRRSTPKSRGKK